MHEVTIRTVQAGPSGRRLAAFLLAATWTVIANAAGQAVIEVPFDLVHGAVLVHVSLEGRGPLAMMLDIGADPSVVDLQTARQIRLNIAPQGEQGSGGGTEANSAHATRIDVLQLGALRATRTDAVAMDLTRLSTALGVPLQGVLGRSLMKGRAFQIDYPKQVVRFFTGSPLRGPFMPDTPQRTTLDYRYRDDILMSGVRINGKPALANLDTGSNGGFQIAPKAIAAFGLGPE